MGGKYWYDSGRVEARTLTIEKTMNFRPLYTILPIPGELVFARKGMVPLRNRLQPGRAGYSKKRQAIDAAISNRGLFKRSWSRRPTGIAAMLLPRYGPRETVRLEPPAGPAPRKFPLRRSRRRS